MSSASASQPIGRWSSGIYPEIARKFEFVVVTSLQVLIIVAVTVATALLFVLFVGGLRTQLTRIESVAGLQSVLQQTFSGVLIVLLGLELLETLKTYFSEHHIRIEVILVVAIIAIGRHIIQVDFEHTPGLQLLGLGALVLCLTLGYSLVKKANAQLME